MTKELNRLRPELEQLKAQLDNYHTVISEKNDLRRLVDSLEVDLENEKKRRQNAQMRQETDSASNLDAQLKRAQNTLTLEKKEREKLKKLHEKELAKSARQMRNMEEEMARLNELLSETRTELNEAQSELELATSGVQEAKLGRGSETIKGRQSRGTHNTFSTDAMANVGTPGYEDVDKRRGGRKRAPEQVMVGEKSAFSITPFLNRSKTSMDESFDEQTTTKRFAEQSTGFPQDELSNAQSQDELEAIPDDTTHSPPSIKKRGHMLPRPGNREKPAKSLNAAKRTEVESERPLAPRVAKKMSLSSGIPSTDKDNKASDLDEFGGKKKKRKLVGGRRQEPF